MHILIVSDFSKKWGGRRGRREEEREKRREMLSRVIES